MAPDCPNTNEQALIREARNGHTEPFNTLVQGHQDRLFNAVYRMVGNYDDAADIVQETFLRAFRGVRGFRGDSSFYTWIFSIAVNAVISERRRRTVPTISAGNPSPDPEDREHANPIYPPDSSSEPTSLVQQRETRRRVQQAIQSLDDDSRTVVVLRDIDSCDYEQIAEILGVPVGTVKSRLHRARLQLREKLADLISP